MALLMDGIFGVGPLELLLIVVIMLIILGPKEMVATSRKVGKFLRDLVKSPYWSEIMNTTREIRDIPGKLVRDAGLEEDLKEIQKATKGQIDELKKITQETTQEVQQAVDTAQAAWPKFEPLPPPAQTPVASPPSGTLANPPETVPLPENLEPITDVFAAAGMAPVEHPNPSETETPAENNQAQDKVS